MTILGKHAGDYFVILCENCGKEIKNEYLGWDPAMPHFRAVCQPCGAETIVKLTGPFWSGLPQFPDSKDSTRVSADRHRVAAAGRSCPCRNGASPCPPRRTSASNQPTLILSEISKFTKLL
jgi:hypothetical protein